MLTNKYHFLQFEIKVVTGNEGHQVELSINKIQIEGEYMGNCMFAGLAIYEEQREDLLLCTNRSLWENRTITVTGNHQSIVSKMRYVILVFYYMTNYTTVVATFNITTSRCTGILINPCEFEAYCSLWLHIKTKNMSLCDNYLQSFSSKQVKVVKEENYIMVSMNLKLLKNNQHDYNTCVHLYLSSDVVAKFQNVFQNDFNINLVEPDCYVHIKVESDGMTIHNILTSIYQGIIKRTETLELTGHGNVVTHNFLIEKQKNAPVINVHSCKHKVKLKASAAVNFESIGKMLEGRVTIFTLAVRGGSLSTMMLRFKIYSSNSSIPEGRWKTCGNMSQKYKVPIRSNVSSTVFQLLSNVITVTYGKILNIALSTEYSGGNTFKDYTVQLMIKSQFCLFKCLRLAGMDYCRVLNEYDPFGTESLNAKLYGNKCNSKYGLHWSQILALSHYNNTKAVSRVLLPGIYEQATIHISHTSLQSNQLLHLYATWRDTNILEKVDISLQLNGRRYQIFKQPRKSNKMYTWMEAEEICIHNGGHLPSISSQSDVQDVVNIILRAVWIGPIRMIYIGLKVSI